MTTEINHEESQLDNFPKNTEDWSFFDEEEGSNPSVEEDVTEESTDQASDEQGEPSTESQDTETTQPQAPLYVLKHNGQEIPINDAQQMIALAQQGLDYTQKTQALSQYRNEISALEAHGDLKTELSRRMRGEAPRPLTTAEEEQLSEASEQKRQSDELEQSEDETYEEWIQRIAEIKANNAVEKKMQNYQQSQQNQSVLQAVKNDPLREPTIDVIKKAVRAGQIPQTVLQQADNDPEAFKWIYGTARQAVEQMINQQRQQNPQTNQQSIQQPTHQPVQHTKKKAVPVMESGGRSRRKSSTAKQSQDAQVIKDMSSDKFRTLLDAVRSGSI